MNRAAMVVTVAVAAASSLFFGAVLIGYELSPALAGLIGGEGTAPGAEDHAAPARTGEDEHQEASAPIPSLFVSHPRLTEKKGHAIRERALQASGAAGAAGVPYLMLFADDRFAFGRTDDGGHTAELYADELTAHTVLWDNDALDAWKEYRRLHNQGHGGPGWGGTGRAQRRSTRERWALTTALLPPPPPPSLPTKESCSVPRGSFASATADELATSCKEGGRKAAKKCMKWLVAAARCNGVRFTCENCHTDAAYSLLPNARADFAQLVAAAEGR